MKVFAIITAVAMATAGGAYYLHHGDCSSTSCPVGKSCCQADKASSCCEVPCPGCATDCLACCDVCELCCSAGAQAPVAAKPTKPDCCAVGDVCCVAGAACCLTASKPVKAKVEDCCPACVTPARVGTNAAVAGASLK